jgi:hypothetical protein
VHGVGFEHEFYTTQAGVTMDGELYLDLAAIFAGCMCKHGMRSDKDAVHDILVAFVCLAL